MARALATRGGAWQRHGPMEPNVQKWFTAAGIVPPLSAMQTRPAHALNFLIALAVAMSVGPACAATGLAGAGPAQAAPEPPAATFLPDRIAQYSPMPPRGRVVSDHDHARQSTRAGENRGFEELMRSAQARGRGEYLGVEPDIDRNIYRFKFLRSGGNVVWVDVDGRTGRVVAERD
jgi:hypothetical protein